MPLFEVRLLRDGGDPLYFQTIRPDLTQTVEYARALLHAHEEFERAEIWSGIRRLGQVEA